MKRWTWLPGRQGTGYRKMLLAQGSRSDCYLLHYPPGARVDEHVDVVPGRRHYRLNLLLRGADRFCGETIFRLGRVVLFRPDICPHSVPVVGQDRYVLSFGVAL